MAERQDELRYRLIEWSGPQWQSEQLAALILDAAGYKDIDPTHPYGGPDRRKDAVASKDGNRWVMASWFPNGKKSFSAVKRKLVHDYEGVRLNGANGLAFVTNQKVTETQIHALIEVARGPLDVFHLARIVTILERDTMKWVRQRYLRLEPGIVEQSMINRSAMLADELDKLTEHVRRDSFLGEPSIEWVQAGEFLVHRVTTGQGADLRENDRILRDALDSVDRAWLDLVATTNRWIFEPTFEEDQDNARRVRAIHSVSRHRLVHDLIAHAGAARARIFELIKEPWRIGRDETDVAPVSVWNDGQPPHGGWPELKRE